MVEGGVEATDRGIVIGASMAGLLAACALANHFEQVVLVERDVLPAFGENRKGVPQGRHTHVLLERGRQVIERYLPGITEDLVRCGAVHIRDASLTVRWFHSGDFHQPGVSGIAGIGVSRPTLEAATRTRVLALPNVRVEEGRAVRGLLTTADGTCVTGVRVAGRADGGREETMTARLVVDTSGRGSRSPAWLEGLGYRRPAVEEVCIKMGYTSCFFRRRPDHGSDLNGLVYLATPPNRRLGVLLAQDQDRWVCTVGGYLGCHAPTDLPGFLEAVRQLPTTDVYDIVREAEPLSEPVAYTFPANVRHRYEKLKRFPEGYLILGDAVCSFNPIYGQGMTVAALEAAALDRSLSEGCSQLAQRFFSRAGTIIDVPWSTAVSSDLAFPEVDGRRTVKDRLLHGYLGQLHRAASQDAQVSIAFLKVINMLAPPASILHPRIVGRVMMANVWPGHLPGSPGP